MAKKKIRVAVLFGGRSGEHEVSLRSAASVIRNLDPERFEIVPVGIDKQGRWRLNDLALMEKSAQALTILNDAPMMVLPPNPVATSSPSGSAGALIPLGGGKPGLSQQSIDVVFPVMHGPLCEDGTVQGLLELADVPYVGCGVLASAVAMDKDIAKRLVTAAGIRVVPSIALKQAHWSKDQKGYSARIASELGFPCFVKPANQGSSVGVHKVKEASQLKAALDDAFKYDTKVLIEKAINAREIEVSVLENADPGLPPLVSVPGEINATHEFYSYEAKYLDDNGAELMIPAKLTAAQVEQVQKIGRDAFTALECEGMARVDMFLDKGTGELYFNEVNTIPGFTSISMYPKMWEASGVSYQALLTKLIELALSRHSRKQALVREFHSEE